MTSAPDHLAVAEELFDAITAGEVDRVLELYSPDAVLVNAATGTSVGVNVIADFVKMLAQAIPDYRYDDIRRYRTESGFVQQHVIRGTSRTGVAFSIPACCVASVVNGRVSVLEEYADSAQMASLGL